MDIQNDTNDPVDYDIQIDGGQGMAMGTEANCFCGTPRFRIKAGATMSFDLSGGSTVNHIFLVDLNSSTPTLVELRGALTNQNAKLVEAEAEQVKYYRVLTFS